MYWFVCNLYQGFVAVGHFKLFFVRDNRQLGYNTVVNVGSIRRDGALLIYSLALFCIILMQYVTVLSCSSHILS